MSSHLLKRLFFSFKQFGGFRLFRFYVKSGALWPTLKRILRSNYCHHILDLYIGQEMKS